MDALWLFTFYTLIFDEFGYMLQIPWIGIGVLKVTSLCRKRFTIKDDCSVMTLVLEP